MKVINVILRITAVLAVIVSVPLVFVQMLLYGLIWLFTGYNLFERVSPIGNDVWNYFLKQSRDGNNLQKS